LQDGKARWKDRKSYGVNFANVMYMLGAEDLKQAQESNNLRIDTKTGEVFVDSEVAKRYFSKSNRMTECSSRLGYKVDIDGIKRLHNAYFCRDRLCPICMWRLSRRVAWETNLIMEKYTAENPDMIPVLMTLTVKNPRMGELSEMLDVLCNGDTGAWQSFRKWLARRGIKDYIRTLEVTLNYKAQTWHPHLHILAFVPKDYFKKGSKNYISHEILKKEWQHVCKLDYETYVNIKRCYDKTKPNERIDYDSKMQGIELTGAIKETAKYCVKPLKLFVNFDDCSEKVKEKLSIKAIVRELEKALNGRRLRALGGKLKKIARELKLDTDENKKDLIHKDEMGTAEAIWEEIYEYVFQDKEYYLTAREAVAEREDFKSNNGVTFENVESDTVESNNAVTFSVESDTADAHQAERHANDTAVGSKLRNNGVTKFEKIFVNGEQIFRLKFEQGAKNFQAVGVEGLALASSIF
jgi:plasmid rolling circle replication initiator protein Rep